MAARADRLDRRRAQRIGAHDAAQGALRLAENRGRRGIVWASEPCNDPGSRQTQVKESQRGPGAPSPIAPPHLWQTARSAAGRKGPWR
jgi:hypothetical protein